MKLSSLIKQINNYLVSSKEKVCKCCLEYSKNVNFTTVSSFDIFICNDCFLQLKPIFIKERREGFDCLFLYEYSDFIKEKIQLLKMYKDIEIAPIFLIKFVYLLRVLYYKYYIVLAPSFVKENQLNHLYEMTKILRLKYIDVLYKTKDIKQSNLNYNERQSIGRAISCKEMSLKGKNILFIDDVFTTGATAKACLKHLKELQPNKVQALFISKTKDI